MKNMNPIEVLILEWLKEPYDHFTPHEGIDMKEIGVCVSQFTDKLNMTQSTASQYLSILQRAGLIKTRRIGKFTYYQRDEEAIRSLADFMKHEM